MKRFWSSALPWSDIHWQRRNVNPISNQHHPWFKEHQKASYGPLLRVSNQTLLTNPAGFPLPVRKAPISGDRTCTVAEAPPAAGHTAGRSSAVDTSCAGPQGFSKAWKIWKTIIKILKGRAEKHQSKHDISIKTAWYITEYHGCCVGHNRIDHVGFSHTLSQVMLFTSIKCSEAMFVLNWWLATFLEPHLPDTHINTMTTQKNKKPFSGTYMETLGLSPRHNILVPLREKEYHGTSS